MPFCAKIVLVALNFGSTPSVYERNGREPYLGQKLSAQFEQATVSLHPLYPYITSDSLLTRLTCIAEFPTSCVPTPASPVTARASHYILYTREHAPCRAHRVAPRSRRVAARGGSHNAALCEPPAGARSVHSTTPDGRIARTVLPRVPALR